MKRILLLALLSSTILGMNAQEIVFSTYTSTYTPVENGTNAIGEAWDDPTLAIPLGFEVSFFGETSSTLYMSDDFLGGIFTPNIPIQFLDMFIATTADLIDPEYFTSGNLSAPITYVTEGEPGNRICKVQWENAGFYNEVVDGTANNIINLQLWVYEAGIIEVHHGPNSVKEFQLVIDDGWTAGLVNDLDITSKEPVLAQAYIISGDPNAPVFVQTNDLVQLFTASLSSVPPNGRVYRFGPDGVINTLELERDELRVWPLTANEVINLSSGSGGTSFYTVYDLSGQLVAEGSFSGSYTLPISHFNNGIYLVNLRTANNAHTFKVVKR